MAEPIGTQLYLTTPPGLIPGGVSAAAFGDLLLEASKISGAAALLLDPGSDASALDWLRQDLLPRLSQRDFALIVKDQPDLALSIQADGVHLSDMASVKQLRSKFADASIGVACPLERHEAMIAAELGADYVAFEASHHDQSQVEALIQWWSEMMTVPSVTFVATPDAAARFAKAGADFIALPADIWQQAEPLKIIEAFKGALTTS